MDAFLSILIPIVLSLGCFWFVQKKLPDGHVLLTYSISLLLGTALVVLTLTLTGIFFPAFAVVSKLLFVCLSAGTIYSIYTYRFVFKPGVCLTFREPAGILIALFLVVYSALFILRPVVDPDIVDSYLPLARTIVFENRLPVRNMYDNRPFTIPPAGGPVFFAFFYEIHGNVRSEIFRYINVPYFLGFICLMMLTLKLYGLDRYTKPALLILLTIPLLEDQVFLSGLYPDFIFAFISVLCFYMLEQYTRGKHMLLYAACIGLALALCMLFKYQAIFVYLISAVILLRLKLKGNLKYVLLLLVYIPWIIPLITGSIAFQNAHIINYIFFLILIGFSTFLFLRHDGSGISCPWSHLFLIGCISILGGMFIFRNFYVFHGLNDRSEMRVWSIYQEQSIGVLPEKSSPTDAWYFFLAPAMAVYWLIPKCVGIYACLRGKHPQIYTPFFIFLLYYAYWVIFLGAVDSKWLFPVFLYIAMIIVIGLHHIIPTIARMKKVVILGIVGAVVSSKFIFWNLGVHLFGQSNFRPVISQISENSGTQIQTFWYIPSSVRILGYKFFLLFTSRLSIPVEDVLFIIIMSLGIWYGIYFLARKIPYKAIYTLVGSGVVALYVFVVVFVSGGDIRNFDTLEQKKLFDYWGQATYLVPYLHAHASPNDTILVFSLPTGISYYTNLHSYNLQFGGGISSLRPVYQETNQEAIYEYLKSQQFRYIAILDYSPSKERFALLKTKTHALDILDNPMYARLVVKPEKGSYWRLYEII